MTEDNLTNLIQEYLLKSSYSNQHLFLEGLKDISQRNICSINHSLPGYCYQQNETFLQILLNNGWNETEIKRNGTIVIKRFEDENIDDSLFVDTIMTHSILILNNNSIIDVGFSDNSLRGILKFQGIEEEVHLLGDDYKFKRHSNFYNSHLPQAEWWSVSIKVDNRWLQLWRFPNNFHINFNDLLHLNQILFLSPQTINIRDNVFVTAKVTPTHRFLLSSLKVSPITTLKIIDSNTKEKEIKEISSWNEFESVMNEYFSLTPLPELKEILNLV